MGILEKMRLDGKKAFVTGGARGIGKCIAIALAEAGADVAIVDVDLEEAEKTAREIEAANHTKTIAVKTDITKPQEVDDMMARILEAFGRLDVAFCNAGIGHGVPVEDDNLADWDRVIQVNLNGTFLTAQAAGRQMIRQGGGSIINTASMSAHIINTPQTIANYCASKGGVLLLTKALAVEWAKYNIRVNCVSPGYMATELVAEMKDMHEGWISKIPAGRLGVPKDLIGAYLYLLSDAARYTTGTDLIVDGGYTSL